MFGAVRRALGLHELKTPIRRLMPYVRRYKGIYAALAFLLAFDVGYAIFFAWFLKTFADRIASGDLASIGGLFLLAALIVAVNVAMDFGEVRLQFQASDRILRDIKNDLTRHLLRSTVAMRVNGHSGDSVSRLTNDVYKINGAVGKNLVNLVKQPIVAVAAFAYLLSLNWKLALICFAAVPAVLVIGAVYGRRMRSNGALIQRKFGEANAYLNDLFNGHVIVRAFQLEKRMEQRSMAYNDELFDLEAKDAKLQGILHAGTGAVNNAAFLLCLGIGAWSVSEGMSIGTLLAFIALFQSVIQPISTFAFQWGAFQRSLAAVDRVCEVMEQPIENGSMTEYRKAMPLRKGIALESIRFRYEPDQPLFEGVSVDIPSGRLTAIVGPSGAGKSTLFHLLLGFYRPSEGVIRMDGKPLDDWDPGARASMFAVVTQEAYLFDGTIRDNIALGRPDATETDIRRAAREANAEPFILELPGGYDTEVGERGAKLSGGQKQRIAIARAILRDAPVLLLDEATSALDSITESAVKAALERLMAGRTTVMIAHRISTVRQADRILVMDGGRVIEQGTHDALLHKGGMYARLYMEQQDAAEPVRTAR